MKKKSQIQSENDEMARKALRALRRAAKEARRVAKFHGTPIYVSKNGKIVAIKP